MAFEKETGDYGIVLPLFLAFYPFLCLVERCIIFLFLFLLPLLFLHYIFLQSCFSRTVFRFLHFWPFFCILEMSSDANPPIPSKSIFPPLSLLL